MYLQDSESFPLLMRAIHQAEDLCESAAHAAYYLRNHDLDYELRAVQAGTSQAGYHLRHCGKMLESGYNQSDWFEESDDLSTIPPSIELLDCLMKDIKRIPRKIRKAISYLADYQDCKTEIRELRKAMACILGIYYQLIQCYDCLVLDINLSKRGANGRTKAKTCPP